MSKYRGSTDLGAVGSLIGMLFVVVLVIAAVAGWVMNIMAVVGLAQAGGTDHILMFMLRVVGIFAPPLGAVLGYF